MITDKLRNFVLHFVAAALLSGQFVCYAHEVEFSGNYIWLDKHLVPLPVEYVIANVHQKKASGGFTYIQMTLAPLNVDNKNTVQLKYVKELTKEKVDWSAFRTAGKPSYVGSQEIAGEDVLCMEYTGEYQIRRIVYETDDYELSVTGPDARELMKRVLSDRKLVEDMGHIRP